MLVGVTVVVARLSRAVSVGESGEVAVTSAMAVGLGRAVLVGDGVKVGVADGVEGILGKGGSLGACRAMEVGGGVAEPGGASSPGT